MKNSALFYTCSLIEYIGRTCKQRRSDVVIFMKRETIRQIYDYADVFHSDVIAKVADEFIELCRIPQGTYDNVAKCRYKVPGYWTIGEVYERLISDISSDNEDDIIDHLIEVYTSWIDAEISDYNSDFYYQSRDYIKVCYEEGQVCA